MIYLNLFLEFFKIGIFAVGGGLAVIPFLYELIARYGWFTADSLSDMIAISQTAPGPVGINLAAYSGFEAAGVLGSLIAVFSVVVPSFIIVCCIYKSTERIRTNDITISAFYGIRPAVAGLIAGAAFLTFKLTFLNLQYIDISKYFVDCINIEAVALYCVILLCLCFLKKPHPMWFIAGGAVVGMILRL